MRTIPGVTSAYLEVLKFFEGLDPRHTTPTRESVSFNGQMQLHLYYLFLYFLHLFFLSMIKVSPHSTSERLIPHWFVGISKGEIAGLWDLMFLHTQHQGSNPRQLVKGEWVLITQPHTPGSWFANFLICQTLWTHESNT